MLKMTILLLLFLVFLASVVSFIVIFDLSLPVNLDTSIPVNLDHEKTKVLTNDTKTVVNITLKFDMPSKIPQVDSSLLDAPVYPNPDGDIFYPYLEFHSRVYKYAIDTLKKVGAKFAIIGGGALAVIRYGAWYGKLGYNRYDMVDYDIDIDVHYTPYGDDDYYIFKKWLSELHNFHFKADKFECRERARAKFPWFKRSLVCHIICPDNILNLYFNAADGTCIYKHIFGHFNDTDCNKREHCGKVDISFYKKYTDNDIINSLGGLPEGKLEDGTRYIVPIAKPKDQANELQSRMKTKLPDYFDKCLALPIRNPDVPSSLPVLFPFKCFRHYQRIERANVTYNKDTIRKEIDRRCKGTPGGFTKSDLNKLREYATYLYKLGYPNFKKELDGGNTHSSCYNKIKSILS